jgi:hypoxanthine phosphoribosyltransferase
MNFSFDDNLGRVIISKEQIAERIKKTGERLSEKYAGKPLLILSVLKGSVIFTADLLRAVTIPCEFEFIRVKSYVDDKSTAVKFIVDTDRDLSKYNVIIAEDIIDSGRTMKAVCEIYSARNPLSLEVVTLLDKPCCRLVEFTPDESLFIVGDEFVVGYGLDFNEFGRNLPYICEFIRKEQPLAAVNK